ncbi:unnamed protein product, partial [Effrenium voratum]
EMCWAKRLFMPPLHVSSRSHIIYHSFKPFGAKGGMWRWLAPFPVALASCGCDLHVELSSAEVAQMRLCLPGSQRADAEEFLADSGKSTLLECLNAKFLQYDWSGSVDDAWVAILKALAGVLERLGPSNPSHPFFCTLAGARCRGEVVAPSAAAGFLSSRVTGPLRAAAFVALAASESPGRRGSWLHRAQAAYRAEPSFGLEAVEMLQLLRALSVPEAPKCIWSDAVVTAMKQVTDSAGQVLFYHLDGGCVQQAVQALNAVHIMPRGYWVHPGSGHTPRWDAGNAGHAHDSHHFQPISASQVPHIDSQIALLILGGRPGQQMEALKALRRQFSLGRISRVVLQLFNPKFHAFADDPLGIYEFLVWHGLPVAPAAEPAAVLASVGQVELAVAVAEAAQSLPVVAVSRARASPWSDSTVQSCQRVRPNTWAEVDMPLLTQRLTRLPGKRRVGVVLSADAFSHDAMLTGMGLISHPRVRAVFVLNTEVALQLRRPPVGRARVVLMHQPLLGQVCRLAEAEVHIAAQSLRWLLKVGKEARRCQQPVRLHVELDTGIGRSGLRSALVAAHVVARGRRSGAGGLVLAGLWTRLCCSGDASLLTSALRRLRAAEAVSRVAVRKGGAPFEVHLGGGLGMNVEVLLKRASKRCTKLLGISDMASSNRHVENLLNMQPGYRTGQKVGD